MSVASTEPPGPTRLAICQRLLAGPRRHVEHALARARRRRDRAAARSPAPASHSASGAQRCQGSAACLPLLPGCLLVLPRHRNWSVGHGRRLLFLRLVSPCARRPPTVAARVSVLTAPQPMLSVAHRPPRCACAAARGCPSGARSSSPRSSRSHAVRRIGVEPLVPVGLLGIGRQRDRRRAGPAAAPARRSGGSACSVRSSADRCGSTTSGATMKWRTRSAIRRCRPRAASASSIQVGRALSPSVITQVRRPRRTSSSVELARRWWGGRRAPRRRTPRCTDRRGECPAPRRRRRPAPDRASPVSSIQAFPRRALGTISSVTPGASRAIAAISVGQQEHAQEVGRRDDEVPLRGGADRSRRRSRTSAWRRAGPCATAAGAPPRAA